MKRSEEAQQARFELRSARLVQISRNVDFLILFCDFSSPHLFGGIYYIRAMLFPILCSSGFSKCPEGLLELTCGLSLFVTDSGSRMISYCLGRCCVFTACPLRELVVQLSLEKLPGGNKMDTQREFLRVEFLAFRVYTLSGNFKRLFNAAPYKCYKCL